MTTSNQLQARYARRSAVVAKRSISPTVQSGVISRGRVYARVKKEEKRVQEEIKKETSTINKLIENINAGKISNVSQIPEKYRNLIGVSQSDLNQINNYYKAKKEADLWAQAYRQAEAAISRGNAFIVAFSSNPYTKTAYQQLKAQYKAYAKRKKTIQDIRAGKISNVKIVGGRIMNLETGKPITPTLATQKQVAEQLQKELPAGDKLIVDKNTYQIKAIDSATLKQTIPFTERGINYYNKEISKAPVSFQELVSRKVTAKQVFTPKELEGGIKITTSRVDFNKKIVTLPNGEKFEIPAKGIVNVGKDFAGQKLVFYNGKLAQVGDKKILEFEEPKIIDRSKIISIERAKNLISQYDNKLLQIKNELREAVDKNYFDRLVELQRQDTLSNIEKEELKSLKNKVAKNYNNFANLIALTGANSLLNIGVGSIELYNAIKKNPEVILALPSALLTGIRQDFNRLMSGDPLEISQLGVEYYTFQKVGKILGKTAKASYKSSLSVANVLSPRYFSIIARSAVKPPVSLRRAVLKTKSGKRVAKIGEDLMKNPIIKKKVDIFNEKAKRAEASINAKIKSKQALARRIDRQKNLEIEKFKEAENIKKQLVIAKKLRNKNLSSWKLNWARPSYKAIDNIIKLESFAKDYGKLVAYNFIIKKARLGQKLSKNEYKIFISAVEEHFVKSVQKSKPFRDLLEISKLNETFYIKIKKPHKLAKKYSDDVIKKINNTKAIKFIKDSWDKVKRKVIKSVKKYKTAATKVKRKITNKFKSEVQHAKELRKVKRERRQKQLYKITKVKVKDFAYIDALEQLYKYSDAISLSKAIIITKKLGKRGFKFTSKAEKIRYRDKLWDIIKRDSRRRLKASPTVKRLEDLSKLNPKYSRVLLKEKSIKPAGIYVNKIKNNIKNFVDKRNKKVEALKTRKRKVEVRRLRKEKFKKLKEEKLEKYLQSNRYLMDIEKAKGLKVITYSDLLRTNKIKNVNKVVDELFEELNKRTNINTKELKYRQLSNKIKEALKKAIRTGDTITVKDFIYSANKIITELNFPSKQPIVRIVREVRIPKKIPEKKLSSDIKLDYVPRRPFTIKKETSTIGNLTPETKPGQFKEVKVGSTILLKKIDKKTSLKSQKLQFAKRAKTANIQKAKVVSVTKQAININSMVYIALRYAVRQAIARVLLSKTKQGFMLASKNRTAFIKKQASDNVSGFVQVSKLVPEYTLQSIIATEIIKSKIIPNIKLIIRETKKPTIRIKYDKKTTRKLKKPVETYALEIRRKRKLVRLRVPPMTLKDAYDFASYKLDNELQRTGKIVPLGKKDIVARLPKGINNYYKRNSKKFRRFRKKVGKKFILERTIIEKKQYVGDTKSEVRALKRARRKTKKVKKKTTLKRKPVKRRLPKKSKKKKVVRRKKVVRKKNWS